MSASTPVSTAMRACLYWKDSDDLTQEIAAFHRYPVPVPNRMTSSTTFSISPETFELFKLRLREMQHQLMEMARLDTSPKKAYQLTLNLFPVSRSVQDDTK